MKHHHAVILEVVSFRPQAVDYETNFEKENYMKKTPKLFKNS